MKISGNKIDALARATVKLPRPNGAYIEVKIKAFPLGDENVGSRIFPDPVPPQDFVKDRKGLPLRNPADGKPVRDLILDDPAYLEKCDEASRMQLVVMALSVMEEIEFECNLGRGTQEWYLAAYEEMKAAGITIGDLRLVLSKARELSNLDSEKLEKAAESFS